MEKRTLLIFLSLTYCLSLHTLMSDSQTFKLPIEGNSILVKTVSADTFTSNTIDKPFIVRFSVLKGKDAVLGFYGDNIYCFGQTSVKQGDIFQYSANSDSIQTFVYLGSFHKIGSPKECKGIKKLELKLNANSEVKVEILSEKDSTTKPTNVLKPSSEPNKSSSFTPSSNNKKPKLEVDKNKPPAFKIIKHDKYYDLILDKLEISKFRKEHLEAHNRRRKDHSAPALTINPILEQYAQNYAEYLIKYRGCAVGGNGSSHSPKALYTGYSEDEAIKGKEIFGEEYWNWAINAYDKFGENLAYSGSFDGVSECNGEKFNNLYYDEIPEYVEANPNYNPNHNSAAGGHFTQQVWKSSTEIGIGYAKCYNKEKKMFVCLSVSTYYPSGNGYRQFSNNVILPDKTKLEAILKEVKQRKEEASKPKLITKFLKNNK